MHGIKFIEFMRHLDVKSFKRLGEFMESSFFPKSKEVQQLFLYVKDEYPIFQGDKLKREVVFQHIFPNKTYNATRFNSLCFEGLECLEKFYLHLKMDYEATSSYYSLFDYYYKHDLNAHSESLVKYLMQIQEKNHLRNNDYWYNEWMLKSFLAHKEGLGYESAHHYRNKMIEGFDIYLLTQKMDYLCAGANIQNVFNRNISAELDTAIITYIKESKIYESYPHLKMYYWIYLLLTNQGEEELFQKFLSFFPECYKFLDKVNLNVIFIYLQNYCLKQIRALNNTTHELQLFQVYQHQIKAGAFLDQKGNTNPTQFRNIVVLSARLKEYEWAYSFIDEYAQFLPINMKEDIENYCIALLRFGEKQYNETLRLLNKCKPTDIFLNLSSRRLLIQTYYEMQEIENAVAALNTLKVFVHRDDIVSEAHKETNKNFVNFLSQIIRYEEIKKLSKVQMALMESPRTADQKWLLEKLTQKLNAMNK